MPVRRFAFPFLVAAVAGAGCTPQPEIRQYTVPKLAVSSAPSNKAPAPAALEQTTLGAIVLAGNSAWFFKMSGDPDAVASRRDEVKKFLAGVRFSSSGEPQWDLPMGWKERPAEGLRFATVEVGDPPLDLAISPLTRDPKDSSDEEYILQNVDRWRGQLGLKPTTAEALAKESEQLTVGGFPATLVELTGTGSGTMGGPFSRGPFSGGAGPTAASELPKDHPPVTTSGTATASQGAGPVKYDVPEGWKEKPAGGLRAASFEVVEGAQKLDISVIPLSAEGPAGDVTDNVNRWRDQVGLPPQSAADVAKELREVAGKKIKWQVVELSGKGAAAGPQMILGAIGKTASAAWFVKLTGAPELAGREKEHFDQFIASLEVK